MNSTQYLKVFAVRDAKAEAFITPFFLPMPAMAARVFGQMVRDPNHQFNQAPQDYSLFCIGEWDMDTGELVPGVPEMIGHGLDYVEETNAQVSHDSSVLPGPQGEYPTQ